MKNFRHQLIALIYFISSSATIQFASLTAGVSVVVDCLRSDSKGFGSEKKDKRLTSGAALRFEQYLDPRLWQSYDDTKGQLLCKQHLKILSHQDHPSITFPEIQMGRWPVPLLQVN